MGSDAGFVEYVRDQVSGAGNITSRKMFGEFALYCDGKVVGLICDNQFFVKPTRAGLALLGSIAEAPPYKGAKPHFLLTEQLEDGDLVSRLIRVTADSLPLPKPKKKKTVHTSE